MDTRDLFDGIVKGFCFGLAGVFTVTGLVCNAGLLPNLSIAHGTNLMVSAIIFYGIPGVIDRIDKHLASKRPNLDSIAKMFEDETKYRGLGGHYRPIAGKKKKRARKLVKRKV
jgi:hypothetical protein